MSTLHLEKLSNEIKLPSDKPHLPKIENNIKENTELTDLPLKEENNQSEDSIIKNETLYLKNLNEKIKEIDMKESLSKIFEQFGEILDIKIKKSISMKGQAFIVYPNITSSENAKSFLSGSILYGKKLIIEYAKNKSDSFFKHNKTFSEEDYLIRKKDNLNKRDKFYSNIKEKVKENHKKFIQESKAKENLNTEKDQFGQPIIKPNNEALLPQQNNTFPPNKNFQNMLANGEINLMNKNESNFNNNLIRGNITGLNPASLLPQNTSQQTNTDEVNFNNKNMNSYINMMNSNNEPSYKLLISNITKNISEDDLSPLFYNIPGFKKINIIAEKKQCFIEFDNESQASQALLANNGVEINGSILNITFARVLK
jgi:U1 small nuclear ribonucleoprotein A